MSVKKTLNINIITALADRNLSKVLKLNSDDFKFVSELPLSTIIRLQNIEPFYQIIIDVNRLKLAVKQVTNAVDRDNLYNEAILLGAAKSTMKELCKMSSTQFAVRRKSLGIETSRVRPKCLTNYEDSDLIDAWHECKGERDSLVLLIKMAKHSGIEINRIYSYFIKNNFIK